jgi:hypothetical protein
MIKTCIARANLLVNINNRISCLQVFSIYFLTQTIGSCHITQPQGLDALRCPAIYLGSLFVLVWSTVFIDQNIH